MNQMHSVLLKDLVNAFSLEIVHQATDYEKIRLTVEDVSRPGLQLAGYFYHFEPMRLQVFGNMEASYIEKLSEAERGISFDRLLSYKCPAFLIARDIPVDPQLLEMAQKHNVTLLRSKEATSTIVSAIITYLKSALAPRITRHAVLMEIYGEGLLLMGESGMGKSETALELAPRMQAPMTSPIAMSAMAMRPAAARMSFENRSLLDSSMPTLTWPFCTMSSVWSMRVGSAAKAAALSMDRPARSAAARRRLFGSKLLFR